MRVNLYSAADDAALQVTRTCSPPGLAIAGEIDESNYADLVRALAAVADWPDGEVHVNLSGVTYCDVAGLRAIIRVATGRDRYHSEPHAAHADGAHPHGTDQDRSHRKSALASGDHADVGRRRVVLHAVSPELTAVLRILGWDNLPDLAISERSGSVPPGPRALADQSDL